MQAHSDQPRLLNVDTGGLRMSFGTFVTLIVSLIGGVVTLATFITNLATRDDLERPARDLRETTQQVEAQARTIEALKATLAAQAQGQEAIRARLDFLIEQKLLQEESDPRAVRASRKAAAKVRERAGEDDPLNGLTVH